jgi:sRNA-binding carbon storage regulator CsrA
MQCFLSENDCLTVGKIQVSVLKIFHNSVKLGITDPQASPSYREEILFVHDDDDETDKYDISYEPAAVDAHTPFAISIL